MSYKFYLLGTFRCEYNGKTFDKIPKGKLQVLLSYVLLHMDQPIDRKALAFMLWPESTDTQAQTNLRKLLYQLKKLLPPSDNHLELKNGQIKWASHDQCFVDAAAFNMLTDEHQLEPLKKAVLLYQGELLPGLYQDWINQQRDEFILKFIRVLQKLTSIYESFKQYDQALYYAQIWLQYDSLSEKVHFEVIRLHLLNGNRSKAAAQYQIMEKTLQEQLGVNPSYETARNYQMLLKTDEDELKQKPSHQLPLVGRTKEFFNMQQAWRLAEQNKSMASMAVLLKGEKGIGKSRLIEEFSKWSIKQGAMILTANCYARTLDLPYEPVISWLDGVELDGLHVDFISEISRIMPSLRKQYPNLEIPEPYVESWQLRGLYQAVEQAFTLLRGPIVLVLDDLQWVDQQSLAMLEYLIRPGHAAPLFLLSSILTSDHPWPEHVQDFINRLEADHRLNCIHIGPLSELEIKHMIEYSPESKDLDEKQLYAASGGNPLYLQELLQVDRCRLSEIIDQPFKALINRRISGTLTSSQRQGVESLAVFGRSASPVFLNLLLLELGVNSPMSVLDNLIERRLFKRTQRHIDVFHDMIRDTVLGSMSQSSKSIYHWHIANVLIQNESEFAHSKAEIAYHLNHAGDHYRAAQYYEHAAKQSYDIFEHDQTIEYCRRQIELLPISENYRPLRYLADALRMKGELKEAERYYREYLDRFRVPDSIELKGLAQVNLAVCLQYQGRYQAALSLLEQVEQLFGWINYEEGLAEVYTHLITIHLHHGRFDQANQYLKRFSSGLTDLNGQTQTRILGLKADLHYEQARYQKALECYKQQIQIANQTSSGIDISKAFFGVALTSTETDQYRQAFVSIEQCLQYSRSVRDKPSIGLAIGIFGKIYLRAGWYHQAKQCLLYSLEQALNFNDRRSSVILLGLAGFALLALDEDEQALNVLESSEALARTLKFPLFQGNSLYYLGYYYFKRKDWVRSSYYLNQLSEMLDYYQRKDLECQTQVMLLECKRASGEVTKEEAVRQLQLWMLHYKSRREQIVLHKSLWNCCELDEARRKALQVIKQAYIDQPAPIYRYLASELGGTLQGEDMLAPPLPEEILTTHKNDELFPLKLSQHILAM